MGCSCPLSESLFPALELGSQDYFMFTRRAILSRNAEAFRSIGVVNLTHIFMRSFGKVRQRFGLVKC